jgi:hypothetical protein
MTQKTKPTQPTDSSENALRIARPWRRWLPLGLASGLPQLVRGENHVDYRYEYYKEDNNRMTINTHSVFFEQSLADSVIAKGELTYDGISGATPTGTVLPSGKIALTRLSDIRRSISLELDSKLGNNNTITPGFAYSKESDYESYGISLNDAVEFNEKNTTLQFGVSHNFDSVREANGTTWNGKQSTEGFIGVSQLLTPKTTFNAAFTYGNDSGYLSDPYRLAGYVPTGFPFAIGVPERRPSHRNKEIVYASVTQYFDSVNASLEGSYRFYHDSYGVVANTVGVTWHQWLGQHFIAEPMFRFYEQSAANFYATTFTGPFSANPGGMHSSDYRLSELYTVDFGTQFTGIINDHVRIVAGYHRYEMHGLDGKTSSAMYPKANIYTIGFSILW